MSLEHNNHVTPEEIRAIKKRLDSYLRNGEEEEFVKQFSDPLVTESCKDEEIRAACYPSDSPIFHNFTYLQYCCLRGLFRAGKCLISSGADLNKTSDDEKDYPPLRMACYNGFAVLVEAILKESPKVKELEINDCFTMVMKNYRNFNNEKTDRNGTLELILKYIEDRNIDIKSFKDDFKNTHLFNGLLYTNEETALRILKRGTFLCSRNRDFVTIEAANALVVEHHLKNCVSIKQEATGTPKITATFNYETWISPLEGDCETDGFFYMSNIDRFKHLLHSPLILSFLFMKWKKSRWIYYLHILLNIINIILIGNFVVSVYNHMSVSKKIFGCLSSTLCLIRVIYRCVLCYHYFRRNMYGLNMLFKLAYSLLILIMLWVCAWHNNTRETKHKMLLSLITVLESFEAVLLSRVMSYHGEMFKIVFINFCKVLLCYIVLILAFSLGYHVLFGDDGNSEVNETFYKVFTLLLGNADEEKYEQSDFSDRLILLFFIFIFAIVFINLLNGLAVNEIGYLIQEAELVTLRETIHYIHSIEMLYMFFGKTYKHFKDKEKVLEGSINEHVLSETRYYFDCGSVRKLTAYFNRIVNYSWTKDIISKLNELFPERRIFSCTITTKTRPKRRNYTNV